MAKSFIMIPAKACEDPEISPQQLRLLCIISRMGGCSPRGCWHSVASLSEMAGISARLVSSYVSTLVSSGYLIREVRVHHSGGQQTNVYRVPLDKKSRQHPNEAKLQGGDEVLQQSDAPKLQGGDEAQLQGGMKPSFTPTYIEDTKSLDTEGTEKKKNIQKKKSPKMVTLEEWEEAVGSPLRFEMVAKWTSQNQFCKVMVAKLIEEFRVEMQSKGKLYADFKATFQNYVNKGYLSKTADQLLIKNSPYAASAVKNRTFDRGVAI